MCTDAFSALQPVSSVVLRSFQRAYSCCFVAAHIRLPGLQGAEQMGRMEFELNVYCSKKAKDSIADFIGHCEVTQAEAKGGLTAGLWLVSMLQHHATLYCEQDSAGLAVLCK